MTRAEEMLAAMWEAYAEQQCGWQDAANYHGHTQCSRQGVEVAGLVFEGFIPELLTMMQQPKPEHFQSRQEPQHG